MVVRSPSYISFHFFELFRIQIDDPIVDADCEDRERKKAGELQGDALVRNEQRRLIYCNPKIGVRR